MIIISTGIYPLKGIVIESRDEHIFSKASKKLFMTKSTI